MSTAARPRCACGRPAVKQRRRPTQVSRWGLPEPVCSIHLAETDDLAERCARGVASVDGAVRGYRSSADWPVAA
jgi:hypothetical protein